MVRFLGVLALCVILLSPVTLSAERVLMLNGTVLEGTILQQSRTAVQLRTTDGQVLLLDKSTIRKIEYGPTAEQLKQLEDARKADEARRLEETRRADEQRRLDEKRKADEARAAEDARRAEEARRADEARREAERRAAVPPVSVPAGWWLEPSLALAGGSTRSLAQQGYGRRLALEETFAPIMPDNGGSSGNPRVITGDKDNWTYQKTSVVGAGLFGGRGRWLGNLAYEQLSTRPSFGYAAFGTQIGLLGGGADKLTGRTAMLEFGYRVVDRASWSLDLLGGARSYREETGPGALRFGGNQGLGLESLVLIQLKGAGSGPQATIRWIRAIPSTRWSLGLSGRVFRLKVTANLDETSLALGNTGSSQHIHAEDGYSLVGMTLAVHAAYRLARQTDVVLGIEGVGTRSSLLEARDLWMYNPTKPVNAGELLLLKSASGSIQPPTKSGPAFAGLSFAVRRRFEL